MDLPTEETTKVIQSDLLTVKAETPVYGGYVLSKEGKVIFIRGAVPGEVVEVAVEERKKDYLTASVIKVIEPSPFRRPPPCAVYGICGGCQQQHMTYERQVTVKEEILVETLKRIGDIDIQLMPSITDNEFGYRHRGQFKVSREGKIGFYREGTRDVVPIEECPLMVGEVNAVLKSLRAIDIRGVKEMHVSVGDTATVLIKGDATDQAIGEIMGAGISGVAFDGGDSIGKDYIRLDLNGIQYSVTPWGFFQSNWSLNRRVVGMVTERLQPLGGKRVLDLYAGAGNFSLPFSVQGGEVVAVEENRSAVEDGRRNATLNGIKNCTFVHAPVEQGLEERKKKQTARLFGEGDFDIVILDPPRPGLTARGVQRLLDMRNKNVVYVSCNPATLARDLKRLREQYDVESVCMADFFPNTYHIEAVAFLKVREARA